MERVLILCARRYSFKDDSGRLVEGTTVHYLTPDVVAEADRRGIEPLTITGPLDLMAELRDLPGVYRVDFRQRPGKNGRPTLQLVTVEFERAIDLQQAIDGAPASGTRRGVLVGGASAAAGTPGA